IEALKIARTRSPVGRSNCLRQGGGGLTIRSNLFDRFARVVKSYANSVLSSFEDPEKILDQAVLEMNDDLTKMRQATAQVLASQKRMENKYKAAQQASEDWYRKAQLALQKGEEDLAREALKRRKSYGDNASSLKAQLDQQKAVVDNLVANTRVCHVYKFCIMVVRFYFIWVKSKEIRQCWKFVFLCFQLKGNFNLPAYLCSHFSLLVAPFSWFSKCK
ncbi:unnamed protein product, partial [Linum tenue]